MSKKIKKDHRPLYARLWEFQSERAPLYGVAIMATLTSGIVYQFSDRPIKYYLVSAFILALYLLQIRTADEAKDFEHDNQFHPDRPVQRGVVSLGELSVINKICIVGQLVLYASFLDWKIFALGLLSQGYAQLTRHEFFIREWLRAHFFTYYFTHYIQLVILFYAMTYINNPIGENKWAFVLFIMLCVIMTELGRKMFSVKNDTTDDTFSAQLGHRGSALTISLFGIAISALAYYFMKRHEANFVYMTPVVIALILVVIRANLYAKSPNDKNADMIKQAAFLMYTVSMVGVLLGA